MRRYVRYSPLGRTRQVRISYGMEQKARDAEILDESTHGLGIKLPDAQGLDIGTKVVVETHKGKRNAHVVRIESSRDGAFQIGLEYAKS